MYQHVRAMWLYITKQRNEIPSSTGVYELPEDAAFPIDGSSQVLFCRAVHDRLFGLIEEFRLDSLTRVKDKTKDPRQGVLLLGNPGIGKSWFLMYLLCRYLLDGKTVVFYQTGSGEYWVFSPSECRLVATTPSAAREPVLAEVENIFLVDPVGGRGACEPPIVPAFTVLASSPNEVNFLNFRKRVQHTLYVPELNFDEVKARCEFKNLDIDPVSEKFELLSGSARYLFSDDVDWRRKVFDAVSKCDRDELQPHLLDPVDSAREVSHWLVHMVPTDDLKAFHLEFPPKIFRLLVDKLVNSYLHSSINMAFSQDLQGQIRGAALESCVVPLLRKSQTLRSRNLEDGTDPVDLFLQEPLTGVRNIRATQQINDPEEDIILWAAGTFESLDGLRPNLRHGYQLTVNTKHGVKVAGLEAVLKALGYAVGKRARPFSLYFLVPPDKFMYYPQQAYQNGKGGDRKNESALIKEHVTQYALELDIPLATDKARKDWLKEEVGNKNMEMEE